MTESDRKFPHTLRKKGQEVKIYPGHDRRHDSDYFTVVYYVGQSRRRTTRHTLEAAEKLGEQILENLCRNQVPSTLSMEDWELLKKLKKVAKDRSPWRLLEDAQSASKALDGKVSLTEAAEFWNSRHLHHSNITVGQAFETYLRTLEPQAAERHLRDVRNRLSKFEEAFRNHALADVSRHAIREFLEAMKVSARTRNNFRGQIVTFFRWAQKNGHLEEGRKTEPEFIDPWKVIETEVVIFTVSQTRRLFQGLREDLEAYASIAAFAGLRPSEIQRLTWGNIDFEHEHIYLSPEVAKKTGRSRYVPISSNLVEWLLPHRKGAGEKVCYLKAPELLSQDARTRGVIDVWPEDVLRHSFCSYRLAQTKNIGQVAEEAGNSPQIIRKHYRRPIPQKQGDEYFSITRDNLEGEVIPFQKVEMA